MEPEIATRDPDWLMDESGQLVGREDVDESFRIQDRKGAEWALEIRSELAGELYGVIARLDALEAHLRAQERMIRRQLAWWDWRFAADLAAYARSLLRGNRRTVQFDWGKVSFRATKGTRSVIDMGEAVAFVEQWKPDAVKVVRTVNLEAIEAARKECEAATGEREHLAFLKEAEPGENVTISTGIDVKEST